MSLNLWLSQPETERKLLAGLRTVMAVVICWAAAASYGLWSAQSAVGEVQAGILSQSRQLAETERELPGKRRLAAFADGVKLISADGGASAEITATLAGLAHEAGAEVDGIRMGDGGGQKAASVNGDWSQETFECSLTGDYESLTRFLVALADSPYILDISALQVLQTDVGTHTTAPRLEMKLSGVVYESSEKS